MAFVYEKVKEEDRELFYSLGIKNCWGDSPLSLPRKWCIDRERNAYLIGIGGGHQDMPYFYDLWWNNNIFRMEVRKIILGNEEVGYDIIWNILKITLSYSIYDKKDEIENLIKEAFSVHSSWCNSEKINLITVNMKCEPELVKGGK